MSRITKAFANKACIAYLTAGDGGELSSEYFQALAKGGANILEVGIPFSDPIADGPVIQLAMERALKAKTDTMSVLKIIKNIRATTDVAIIVFTYFNPIMSNLEQFLTDIKAAGADGVLVVDVPLEESGDLINLCNKVQISPIMVAAPSTPLPRIELLTKTGSGFLYYACRKGTTGVQEGLSIEIIEQIKAVKQVASLPVAVGFGVSNNKMVNQLLGIADGCVVGSYFVNLVAAGKTPKELELAAKEIFDYGTNN